VSIAFIILSVLAFIDCVLLIGLILAQKKSAAGFTSAMGGMSSGAPTYWDKNKGRSLEGKLELYTKITAALFVVLVIACNIVSVL
jgi:preprotein translocase subunit SecG